LRVRTEFPRRVRRIGQTGIALADGTRLAARIWLTPARGRRPRARRHDLTTYRVVDGDPLSASVRCRCASTLPRGDWHTRVATDSHMTVTATHFLVTHALDAYEGDERVYARTWTLTFPRDGV